MGCHTSTFATMEDCTKENSNSTEHLFLFRVFDYQTDVLTSYEQAESFVLETLRISTNRQPKRTDQESSLTYTGEMEGKILLANENDDIDELLNPSLTLQRLREFYTKYPEGVITFG